MFNDCDIISTYTPQQGVEDGVLVNFSKRHRAEVREAGLAWRVYITASAYKIAVEMTDTARECGCSVKGRAWDVAYLLRWRVARKVAARDHGDTFFFDIGVVRDLPEPDTIRLKVSVGGDGAGQLAFFVMLPHED